MSQFNDEETIKDLLFRLFRAENHQSRQDATEILATDYLPITRWRGQVDTSRDDTLEKIGAGSPLFVRHIERTEVDVAFFLENHVGIVSSLLLTTDSRETPSVEASYRNMHIFLKRDDRWKCVAWQVTKVQ